MRAKGKVREKGKVRVKAKVRGEGEGEGDTPGGCSCAGADGTAVLAIGLISLPILVVQRRRARHIQGLDRV